MQKSHTLFIFNIRRSVYQNFGIKHFEHLNRYYSLVPIINNHSTGIQQRAATIVNKVKQFLSENKEIEKVNLVSYSLSGIDARYAISNLEMSQYCKSLVTIGTPHRGSKGILLFDQKHFSEQVFDPIGRIMGVGLKPLTEFVPSNMDSFNEVVPNAQNVKYYSIGGQSLPNSCSKTFRDVCLHLREMTHRNYVYQNDGVVGFDQCIWGHHLVNFEKDHAELVGLNSRDNLKEITDLINDVQQVKDQKIFGEVKQV